MSPSKEIPPPPPPLHSGTLPRTAKERLRHTESIRVCHSESEKSDQEGRCLKRATSENFKYFGPHASIREPELLQNQQNESRNSQSCQSLDHSPISLSHSAARPGRPIPVTDLNIGSVTSTTKQTSSYLPDSSTLFLGSTAQISTNPVYLPCDSTNSPTSTITQKFHLPVPVASDSDDMNSNTDITPTSLNTNYSKSQNESNELSSTYIGERLAITHRSPMKRTGPGGARRLSQRSPSQQRSPTSPTKRRQSQGRGFGSEVIINITKVRFIVEEIY